MSIDNDLCTLAAEVQWDRDHRDEPDLWPWSAATEQDRSEYLADAEAVLAEVLPPHMVMARHAAAAELRAVAERLTEPLHPTDPQSRPVDGDRSEQFLNGIRWAAAYLGWRAP